MEASAARADYSEFIRRIREGDEHAAEELVRQYEPEYVSKCAGGFGCATPPCDVFSTRWVSASPCWPVSLPGQPWASSTWTSPRS